MKLIQALKNKLSPVTDYAVFLTVLFSVFELKMMLLTDTAKPIVRFIVSIFSFSNFYSSLTDTVHKRNIIKIACMTVKDNISLVFQKHNLIKIFYKLRYCFLFRTIFFCSHFYNFFKEITVFILLHLNIGCPVFCSNFI